MTDPQPTPLARRLIALTVGLGLVLAGLVAAGRMVPGPPISSSVTSWTGWEAAVGPAGMVMGLVRTLAIGVCGYLLVLVAVESAGQGLRRPHVVVAGRRLWAPWVAGLMGPVAGAGLLLSSWSATPLMVAPAGATGAPSARVVMHQVEPTGRPPAPSSGDGPPVMVVIGPAPGPTDSGPRPDPPTTTVDRPPSETPSAPPTPSAAPTPSTEPAGVTDPTTWTIHAGDHLWGVARATLARHWHRVPTDAEILGYLGVLVAANQDRLAVPGNADLVYPGQVFDLPPLSAPTG